MIIQNGLIYNSDFHFSPGTIHIKDGFFSESRDDSDEIIDASGCYVIPGLIDIHFHGCMDADFCDGTMQALHTIAAWEASQGVTAICPATLTLPAEELKKILANGAAFARRQSSMQAVPAEERPAEADLIGINMEGPFISPIKKGAQNGAYILPCDSSLCLEFLNASDGLVRLIGLAPEENPDFEDYIRAVRNQVRVSLAHTNADYDTAMKAFAAGACHAVHLYNAMPEMTHRAPGVVGAVRDTPGVFAELICDGNHVHPAVVRAAFDMLSDERIVLISDSLRAAGMGDGLIMLGGQQVRVEGTRATLVEGGNLAGSVTSLMNCMRIAVREMGIPLESAVRCATANPARAIGVQDQYGFILPGRRADAVLLDRKDLRVRTVIKDGQRIV